MNTVDHVTRTPSYYSASAHEYPPPGDQGPGAQKRVARQVKQTT